jgi:flagellar biosynthesis protein FliQ
VSPDFAIHIARQALIVTMLLSAPMLGFSLLVGLVVSILQAVTQVNESTLSFIPKIIAVMLSFAITLPWLLRTTVDFTVWIFSLIQGM